MEQTPKPPPSAEELLRRIQELEASHAQINHEISNLMRKSRPPKAIIDGTETQYLNIIESMGQAVHVFDRKYRICFWNRIAEDIYGLSHGEVLGKTPTEILVDPKDAMLADYLLERTINGETWSGEFPVTNKRGESFVIVCTNTPFRDQSGRLTGGICVFTDSRPYQKLQPPAQASIASKISNLVMNFDYSS